MINSGMGTIRKFEYEPPITTDLLSDELPEIDAKICNVVVNGESFIEIKTLGPVDEMYHPDDLQVLRLSKEAIDLIVEHWRVSNG